ncbi:endonuclease/exonuclease/phosphatase family protein [Falsarthrobacter nasiphocae]|uniref:Endonuclease/exonuclease/phosphatase family metal-dependent hydrolase n=1 Tax=Falsarthrobacter nasiphocae TaxID=189863 RepID=A0AAE3YH62_9MICC|nr:endonuclease/exonuclease/phosphatase family protein [Falsarthrobacter nasiphocae]MDR6892129.1 endonuclease/exonuclease/phosphatase family metal-dependent hydrolase [Falsarthrobacter nasiphocae]
MSLSPRSRRIGASARLAAVGGAVALLAAAAAPAQAGVGQGPARGAAVGASHQSSAHPGTPGQGASHQSSPAHGPKTGRDSVRVATFNASLNRGAEGELQRDLSTPGNAQARAVADVIQSARPDIVLVNEFDYDSAHRSASLFRANYLNVGHGGHAPIDYPYMYTAPVNTGMPSGVDLDRSGSVGGPNDAKGFGLFPGQYGMVIYSKYPIDTAKVRTFKNLLWKDMPGAALPDDPATPEPGDWYSPAALNVLPLSSKSHWDVPVRVGGKTIHVLASHPTPPSFDGPEDRNGRRNHDEIRLWADYVSPSPRASSYIVDDAGRRGGLPANERFVILGDMNADPVDGDSYGKAIWQVLAHPRVTATSPMSLGGPEASRLQGGANATQKGDPRLDTADFGDNAPGNLRVDYVLPSKQLTPRGSGVFWPAQGQPGSELTGVYPFPTSDHRLVWVDLKG